MTTITANEACTRLHRLIEDAASSHKPILITGKKTNAVLLSEEDWSSIQETLFLLSAPGMQDAIVHGLKTPPDQCSRELEW